MKPEKILRKAIEKAVKNGYKDTYGYLNGWRKRYLQSYMSSVISSKDYYRIIFSHQFAKAFWGEDNCIFVKGQGVYPIPAKDATQNVADLKIWEFHLQQMVLEKDPLKYLERFL